MTKLHQNIISLLVWVFDDRCGYDEDADVNCLIPGQKYYIMVDGEYNAPVSYSEDQIGEFTINVTDKGGVPSSTNDDVCQAVDGFLAANGGTNYPADWGALSSVGTTVSSGPYNNACATTEPFEEGTGSASEICEPVTSICTDVDNSLWFQFVAPASGSVTIDGLNTGNDQIDIALSVWDFPGGNCLDTANAAKIVENYDYPTTFSADRDLEVCCLTPGSVYYIQVDGVWNPLECLSISECVTDELIGSLCGTGEFTLDITHEPEKVAGQPTAPSNDDYCFADFVDGATQVIPCGGSLNGSHNNYCATLEQGEEGPSGLFNAPLSSAEEQDRTVWFVFQTCPTPGDIFIETDNVSGGTTFIGQLTYDTDIQVYEIIPNNQPLSICNFDTTDFDNLLELGDGDVRLLPLPNLFEETFDLTCP